MERLARESKGAPVPLRATRGQTRSNRLEIGNFVAVCPRSVVAPSSNKWNSSGSEPRAKTTEIVCVCYKTALVGGVVLMTSGCVSTNSFACCCIRTRSGPAQRISIRKFLSRFHPSSNKPSARACIHFFPSTSPSDKTHQDAEPRHRRLLRACSRRQCCRCASNKSDEFSPPIWSPR
jgi:hypothetical protein